MTRIALGIEYDGSRFEGWQSQPHGHTVQDTLEAALATIAGERIVLHCAGRTDTGVHGSAQVAHFDTGASRPLGAWVRGTNSHLPNAVSVLWAREVSGDFHARFSARARHYRYLLVNRPVRPAILSGRVGWFHQQLDVDAMREACVPLLGRHDFSAFRAASCQAASPVREMEIATVERQGDYLVFDFRANGFLHHMVRNLVGSLVYVGKGRHPPSWVGTLLASGHRALAAPTFAPDGLYLAGVIYPYVEALPEDGRIIALPQLPLV